MDRSFESEVINKICIMVGRDMICGCHSNFPNQGVCGWETKREITKVFSGAHFECLKLLMQFINYRRDIKLIEICEFKNGLIYKLNFLNIVYEPTSAHGKVGNIIFTGGEIKTGLTFSDFLKFLKSFKTNRYTKRFCAKNEIMDHRMCKLRGSIMG